MSLTYSGTQTGILQCMGGSVNLNSIITAVAPGGGGGSVNSVGGATGSVILSSGNSSLTFGNPSASSLTIQVDTDVIATKASVDTAQQTADQALTDAGTAQASANQAQADADNAQTDATQALANASTAQASANTAQSTINAQLVPAGVGKVGTSADPPNTTTSLWAYGKQANNRAVQANNAINAQLVANGVGVVGTSADTPSLTTSLWAYAKKAETDAQQGITDAGTANTAITTLTTADAVDQVGTRADTPDANTSLWAYAKYVKDFLPSYKQAEYEPSSTTTLTTSWATYQTLSLTTTLASGSIIVWADADFTQTSGASVNISIRLVITPTGQSAQISKSRSIDITNNHRQNISITFAGVGDTTPGGVDIELQAIATSDDADFNISAITAMINPTVLA